MSAVLGIGFLLSAVNVRFRDVRYMIPVFLQVLPLLSGVMFAIDEIPEKWQWIQTLNPMTTVISGWALGGARQRCAGGLDRRALGIAVGAGTLPGRPRRLSVVRAPIRRHDLMTDLRSTPSRFRRSTGSASYRAAYGTLRETIVHATEATDGTGARGGMREIWALKDVSFEVPESQVLGIIGRDGAGKSTLLKILTRIVSPTSGRAEIRGRVGSLLEVGTGFNQELTGRENVYLNGAILGMKRKVRVSRGP